MSAKMVIFVPTYFFCFTKSLLIMATGSLFWGTSKGKLGNVVYRVRRGVEVASKYQPNVDNPRTISQMEQRIRFAVAVKFYKSAIAKMFKFAYEDKGSNESDYNAFMRHNTLRSMILKREQYDSSYYPAIGDSWQMSYGSLPTHEVNAGMDRPYMAAMGLAGTPLEGGNKSFQDQTISDISNWLILNYGYQNGDLFTVVRVDSNWSDITEELQTEPSWEIVQIRIDSGNYNTYRNIYGQGGLAADMEFDDAANALYLGNLRSTACGYAVIHSRQTSNKLLVSTQELVLNDAAIIIWNDSFDQPFYNEALGSWGAQTDAVLQGAIADGDMSTITVGIKDLKKARYQYATLRGQDQALTEAQLIQLWDNVLENPDETTFNFKSNGQPADNQFFAPFPIPVNGVNEAGQDSYGVLIFVFTEPVISGSFNAEDFNFVYTNVNGDPVELEAPSRYVTSFNPSGSGTGASYYALQVFMRADSEPVADIGGVPEYNWKNCHVYYKGIYVGRITVIWYQDPA